MNGWATGWTVAIGGPALAELAWPILRVLVELWGES